MHLWFLKTKQDFVEKVEHVVDKWVIFLAMMAVLTGITNSVFAIG